MTVTVTMLDTRMGEDDTLWTTGTSHDATEAFASTLVQFKWATANLPFSMAPYGAVEAEKAGVHYNNTAARNVAAFNNALSKRGLVTLTTPGQYLIGGAGQGGLLVQSNTTLVCAEGVELILADATYEPLIRAKRQFDVGTAVVGVIDYNGSAANIYGTISNTPGIHLKHPVGSWIAILGLDLAQSNNRGYQGIYQVSAVAENSITYEMVGFPPSGTDSTVGAIVYPVDTGIRIIGGVWDGNGVGNGQGGGNPYNAGDPHTHIISLRNVQDAIVGGVKLRRGFAWSIGTNNIRDCTFRALYADLYGDGLGSANTIIQGSGGARNVLIDGVAGTCEDNMVAWSLDTVGTWEYQDHWCGDVYDLRIQNVFSHKNTAAPVMLWGNVNAKYHSVTIDGVSGRSQNAMVGVDNGFTQTAMLNTSGGSLKIKNVYGEANAALIDIRSDGTWDHIEIDGAHLRKPNAGLSCVKFSKRTGGTVQTIKRVDISNCSAYIPGSPNNRIDPIIDIQDTNIDDLRISGLPIMRINAANLGVVEFNGTEGVVKNAVVSDIRGESVITGDTCLVRCANTGAGALGQLTLRDSVMTGFDATGGLVHQTATGKVARVRIDNTPVPDNVRAGHINGVLRDGTGMAVDVVDVTSTAAN